MGVRTIALNVLEWHRWCMKHMLVAERSLSLSLSLSLITNRTFVGCLSPNHLELEDASLHFRDSLWSISFT